MQTEPQRPLKIVFLSHTAATSVFRVGSHHLSREMARAGHEVAHVSTPVSILHALTKRDPDTKARLKASISRRIISPDGVTHIVPIVPVPINRMPEGLRALALRLTAGFGRRSLRRRWKHADIIFIDQPLLEPLARFLKPARIVYRPTDAHYDEASRNAEIKLIHISDAVVAMSPRVLDEVLEGIATPPRTTFFENGVDYDRFACVEQAGPRRGIIYLGALDKRFDWSTLVHLANSFPADTFRIVGPRTQQVPQSLPANVVMYGGVPYEKVPELLSSAAVGVLPFSDDPGNNGRSPMKYYEYLAAGLYVVARTSPTLSKRETPGVWLYEDHASAANSISKALSAAAVLSNDLGRAHAQRYSWPAIATNILNFVLLTNGATGAVIEGGE